MLRHRVFIWAAALYAILYILLWCAAYWLSESVPEIISEKAPKEYNLAYKSHMIYPNFSLGMTIKLYDVTANAQGVDLKLSAVRVRVSPLSILRRCAKIKVKGQINEADISLKGWVAQNKVDLKGDLAAGSFNINAKFEDDISISGSFDKFDFIKAMDILPAGDGKSSRLIPDIAITEELIARKLDVDLDFNNSSFGLPIDGNLQITTDKEKYDVKFKGKIAEGKTIWHEWATRSIPMHYTGDFQIKDGKIRTAKANHDLNMHWQSKSSGSSLRELVATSTGKTWASVGPGELDSKLFKLLQFNLITDVVKTINPFNKTEDKVMLECAGLELDMAGGKAKLGAGSGMKTDHLEIEASGKINLENEKLSIQFQSVNFNPFDLNISPVGNLIELNGTLASPSVGISPMGAVKTGLSTVNKVTGGVTGLIGSITGQVTEEKKANMCERLNALAQEEFVRQK